MISEIKTGILLNYVSIALRIATSFLLTPYIISSLGVDEYGLFTLSHTIIGWLALTDLGLGATVSKYVVTYKAKGEIEQQAHFLGQSMILYSVLGCVGLAIGLIGYEHLDILFPALQAHQRETFAILYLLTLGNFCLCFPLRPLNSVPGAYQKFIIPGIISLCSSLLNATLTVLLLFQGFKSIGLTVMSVSVAAFMLMCGISYTLFKLKVKVHFDKPDLALYRGMFSFAFWIFLNRIMDLFYWHAGAPILANVCGTSAVAVFTLAISFSIYFMTASSAISGIVAPKLMHMVALNASKEELTNVMIRAGRLQLFILSILLMGIIFWGLDFFQLWIGSSMGDKATSVWQGTLVILIPLIVPLTQNTGISILQALSIHRDSAIILFYSSLICVILGYLLSISFGPSGMFTGTSISLIFGQIIMMNLYYKYKAGLYIGKFFRHTYLPTLLPGILVTIVGILLSNFLSVNNWNEFFIAISTYGSICLLIFFLLYLNKEERKMFISPLKKILHI